MQTNKKAVLFDLDGTLIDTRDFLVNTSYAILEKHFAGVFTTADIKERFGDGFKRLLPRGDVARNTAARKEFHAAKQEQYHLNAPLFPGVREGLQAMKEGGLRLGIVTNQNRALSLRALETNGIAELFDTVVAADDVAEGKPSPEGILRALEQLNVELRDAAMVGDAMADLLAAQRAGVDSCLLAWYEDVDIASKCTPDHRFTDFARLSAWIVEGAEGAEG